MKRQTGFTQTTTFVLLLIGSVMLSGCGDEFLTRLPEDQISQEDYWNSPADMRLYVNQFYTVFPSFPAWGAGIFWEDGNSDNMVRNEANNRLAGLNTNTSGNSIWGNRYSQIRDVNYMLVNTERGDALSEEAKRYVGEARFFRSYFYYQLLKAYGAVPWISKPLDTDSEELYTPRTPRNQVVDSILVDLDYAIANLPPKNQADANRLNKEAALLFKSRVALFEGTWEKYHQGTSFGVEGANGQQYLEIAADASKQLIDMGTANVYVTGDPSSDYWTLFNQEDLSGNSEVLLWKRYDVPQNMSHNLQRYLPRIGGGIGLTKALVDAYLADDGDPIAVSGRYQGDATLEDVVANRDPRLRQVIWLPGDITKLADDGSAIVFDKPSIDATGARRNTTGYQLKKGASTDPEGQESFFRSTTAAIIFRYAEALLNYAEAQAELGQITQADLDRTVNRLRNRVDMPALVLGSITADPNWDYPNLSPVLNEIRRERRVELAAEGYRLDDILRWRAADEVVESVRPLGAQFEQSKYPDLTVGEDIYVNQDGYIEPYQNQLSGGWGFDSNRDYLLAIPPEQITLNDKLTQNPGW